MSIQIQIVHAYVLYAYLWTFFRHREWRKIAKKMRRKRIRTMKAVERDEKLKEGKPERIPLSDFIVQ